MATLEEIEQRRAARRAKNDDDRKAQEALDLEAIDALEAADGMPLHTMTANGYKPGVAVKIAFRAPSAIEYKRYKDLVNRAGKDRPDERVKAQEQLAACCMVYPAADTAERKALLDAFAGVLISLSIEAAKVAEARSEDEGK